MKYSFTFKNLLIGLISLFLFNSCLKDNDEIANYPQSAFSMLNAYNSSAALIYSVDNNNLQTINNPLGYKQYSYSYLFPGNRRIKVRNNENQELADSIFTFKDSTLYTSFVYGDQNNINHIITEDKVLKNLNNEIGMRFFNMALNTSKVTLSINDVSNVLYTLREFQSSSSTAKINHEFVAKTYTGKQKLIITDEASNILIEREFDFVAGKHYSIILMGDKNSTTTPLYLGIAKQYD